MTDDMKTHKNPALRQGPAPFKAAHKPSVAAKPAVAAKTKAPERPPLIELQNKKWVVVSSAAAAIGLLTAFLLSELILI